MKDEWSDEVKEFAEQIPSSMRNAYFAALRGRSMRKAITAFCQQCVGWQRKEIENCQSQICPLKPYRPYRPQSEPKDRRLVIKKRKKTNDIL